MKYRLQVHRRDIDGTIFCNNVNTFYVTFKSNKIRGRVYKLFQVRGRYDNTFVKLIIPRKECLYVDELKRDFEISRNV